ncbi:dihydrofolate reductase [Nocardioides daphniae]|uniref:Dihydrofolate reductase n=1 Tax=Nocardioides daphniae TaxID=402297 RepID=A0A4P7UDR2_9ACTN|nr:dihydrofolate reductase [Nocardioides daphniae]QCC77478.1 dihydrofolate reductase [Nocardioides daphniae]GGD31630.1 dihydrofolate reductase [Nocardioides daphniae]
MSAAAQPRVTLIAAHSRGRVIGDGPDIPWHSSEDFGHFKATTLGHTLVMGRVTHESIGRPLPGRRTIVVTRDPAWRDQGVDVAHSIEQAIAMAGDDEVFVAGGAQIYAAALPLADRQILTEVDVDVPGDAHYPEFDADEWVEVRRISRPDLDPPLSWVWWDRT